MVRPGDVQVETAIKRTKAEGHEMTMIIKVPLADPKVSSMRRHRLKLDGQLIARAAKLYDDAGDADWEPPDTSATTSNSKVEASDDPGCSTRLVVLRSRMCEVLAVYEARENGVMKRIGRVTTLHGLLRQEASGL